MMAKQIIFYRSVTFVILPRSCSALLLNFCWLLLFPGFQVGNINRKVRILMLNFVEGQQAFFVQDFFVFPGDTVFPTHLFEFLMLDEVFSEFVFDVANQEQFREGGMQEVAFVLLHHFVIAHNSIFEVSEQQFAKFLQFWQFHEGQLDFVDAQGVVLEVLDGLQLFADAFHLVVFVEGVNAEPGGDGGGVGIEVVDEEGTAHGQDLDDDQRFHSMQFLSHAFLEDDLFVGEGLFGPFLFFEFEVGLDVFPEGFVAFYVDVFGLSAVHLDLFYGGAAVGFCDVVQVFLFYVGVAWACAQQFAEVWPLESVDVSRNKRFGELKHMIQIGKCAILIVVINHVVRVASAKFNFDHHAVLTQV